MHCVNFFRGELMEYIVSDVARPAHKKSSMDQLLLDGI